MARFSMEKLGTSGAVLAALACPICFPKLALFGAVFGFGVFAPMEGYIAIGIQVLFILALLGQVMAYRRHRNRRLLALSIGTTLLMFAAYYVFGSSILLQISLMGLVAASIWLIMESRRCAKCMAESSEAQHSVRENSGRDNEPA